MNAINERGGLALALAVEAAYTRGATDYSMPPLVARDSSGFALGRVQDGDSVIFCCRRGEREIELTEMFTDPAFSAIERKPLRDLIFVPLTLYHEKFRDLPVAFQPEKLKNTLAQVVSRAGKTQFHLAESEKFPHITFFFNGGNSRPAEGETDVCIPSIKGVPFEKQPAMRLYDVTDTVVDALGKYDLIAVNFANGDVVGHTSSCDAKLEAAAHISRCLARLSGEATRRGYTVLVTADHGNLERMLTSSGAPDVAHTANPVPFVLINPQDSGAFPRLKEGLSLSSVAPTVLKLMGIPKPRAMTAPDLLDGPTDGCARKVALVILDGWGMGAQDQTNPIFTGDTEPWKTLFSAHPHTLLNASGTEVGLGRGKPGNSEAGHLNLGAGRMVPQDDQRLENALADGSFAQNPVFLMAIDTARRRGKALHLIAYLTHQSSHGAIEYALKLCAMARDLKEVYLHVIFDGRSTENGSAPAMLRALEKELEQIGQGRIVDGVGRGYALDRDHNWDKVKQSYDAMVLGRGTPYTL